MWADHIGETGLPTADRRRLLEALLPLFQVKEETNATPQELAEDIAQALASSWDGSSPDDAPVRLKKNLEALLSLEELGLRAKIAGLLSGDERAFCETRIVTDLRPVFGRTVDAGLSGMGMIHLLSIGYHTSGDHHEIQIALTPADLQLLKEAVARAEKKALYLKEFLSTAGVRHLGDDL